MDEVMTKRILEQVFELWANPEIERRKAAGALPADFVLNAVQVIMTVTGGAPEVRFNEEVRAVMYVKPKIPKTACDIGKPILWDDVEGINSIELTDLDPEAAHITLLRRPAGWVFTFDFRYNAATSKETLTAAREFLVAAERSLEDGRTRSFADELHSATELMAKALLMLVPDEKYLTSNNHKFFAARFNSWGKMGNVPRPFVKLLNDVRALRGPARYLQGSFDLESDEASAMLKVARDMMSHAEAQIPGRVPVAEGRWAKSRHHNRQRRSKA